ncbi:MAG: hypothetical protein AMXMBFR64_42920 [Myxococcales bacterium]
MRALALTILTLALAVPVADAFQAPWTVESRRLDNGLTVAAARLPTPGVVAVFVGVRVGSRDELDPGHTGFAHLFEHMMFRGTASMSEGEHRLRIQRLGLDTSAYTWDDQTVYYTVGPASALGDIVALEADRLRNLSYTEDVFQTEARAVMGEHSRGLADPWTAMMEALLATAFTVHSYGHPTMGVAEDIRRMPSRFDYSREFRRRHYVPQKTTLVLTGDVDLTVALALAEEHLGSWRGEGFDGAPPVEPPQTAPREVRVPWATPVAPRLLMGWRVPPFSTGDSTSAAIEVATELAFGRASPTWRRLVVDEQVVEDLDLWSWPHRDAHLAILAVRLRAPAAMDRVRQALQGALDDIGAAEGGPWLAQEVPRARDHLVSAALLDVQAARDLGNRLIMLATVTGEPRSWLDHLERLAAVEPGEVARAAARLSASVRTTVVLTGGGP